MPDPLATFTVAGEPASKGRPVFTGQAAGRARAITPAATRVAEGHVAWAYRLAARGHSDITGEFGVMCLFHMGTRRRRDIDNMLKLVLDALNGIAWADDHQVVEIQARKVQATTKAAARTEVVIYRPVLEATA